MEATVSKKLSVLDAIAYLSAKTGMPKVTPPTIRRWMKDGCPRSGTILKFVPFNGRFFTTAEWMDDFIEACSGQPTEEVMAAIAVQKANTVAKVQKECGIKKKGRKRKS